MGNHNEGILNDIPQHRNPIENPLYDLQHQFWLPEHHSIHQFEQDYQPQQFQHQSINHLYEFHESLVEIQNSGSIEDFFFLDLNAKPIKKKKPRLETRKIGQTSECPICFVNIRKNTKIPNLRCKHTFHKKCLISWLQKADSCPLCRSQIN